MSPSSAFPQKGEQICSGGPFYVAIAPTSLISAPVVFFFRSKPSIPAAIVFLPISSGLDQGIRGVSSW